MGGFSFRSGSGGEGGGEPFLGGGEAGTGVGPVGEDERGLVLLQLGGGLGTSPCGAGVAERAEGGARSFRAQSAQAVRMRRRAWSVMSR